MMSTISPPAEATAKARLPVPRAPSRPPAPRAALRIPVAASPWPSASTATTTVSTPNAPDTTEATTSMRTRPSTGAVMRSSAPTALAAVSAGSLGAIARFARARSGGKGRKTTTPAAERGGGVAKTAVVASGARRRQRQAAEGGAGHEGDIVQAGPGRVGRSDLQLVADDTRDRGADGGSDECGQTGRRERGRDDEDQRAVRGHQPRDGEHEHGATRGREEERGAPVEAVGGDARRQ